MDGTYAQEVYLDGFGAHGFTSEEWCGPSVLHPALDVNR